MENCRLLKWKTYSRRITCAYLFYPHFDRPGVLAEIATILSDTAFQHRIYHAKEFEVKERPHPGHYPDSPPCRNGDDGAINWKNLPDIDGKLSYSR